MKTLKDLKKLFNIIYAVKLVNMDIEIIYDNKIIQDKSLRDL